MKISFISICLLSIVGCASPSYLSKPEDFKYYVKGLMLDYETNNGAKGLGELIAVNNNDLVLISLEKTPFLFSLNKDEIAYADIIVASTSDNPKAISWWGGLINLLSIGHGAFAIISLPINILATTGFGTNAAKSTYRIEYPQSIQWNEMHKFARFPQGIPLNIDLKDIK